MGFLKYFIMFFMLCLMEEMLWKDVFCFCLNGNLNNVVLCYEWFISFFLLFFIVEVILWVCWWVVCFVKLFFYYLVFDNCNFKGMKFENRVYFWVMG